MPRVEIFNRDKVLDQMISVFHSKGYNATSMQDLVDATNLNRSSLYNSFGNKLSIFLECLKVYQDKTNRETSAILLKSNNALSAIESVFRMNPDFIENSGKSKGCLIVNCTSEMANQEVTINRFLKNSRDNMIAFFKDLVTNGQQQGIINTNKNSNEYALFLFSSLQGFRSAGILLNDEQQLTSIIDVILDNLK